MMTARFFVLAGILLAMLAMLAMAGGAAAQDSDPACVVDDVLNTEYQGMVQRDWLQSVMITLNANIDDGDTVNFLGTARELRRVLARLDANCRGLAFSSEVDGEQAVIGPINFASGVWRAVFTVNGVASVQMETLSGTCKSGFLFTAIEGDGTEGAESIYKSADNCEALISVSYVNGDWDLMFVPIKLDD